MQSQDVRVSEAEVERTEFASVCVWKRAFCKSPQPFRNSIKDINKWRTCVFNVIYTGGKQTSWCDLHVLLHMEQTSQPFRLTSSCRPDLQQQKTLVSHSRPVVSRYQIRGSWPGFDICVSDFLLPHQHYCLWWLKHCKILRIIPGTHCQHFFSPPLGINSSSEKRRQRVLNVGVAAEMSLSFHNAEMCLMWVNEEKAYAWIQRLVLVSTEQHTYSHIVFFSHTDGTCDVAVMY